MSAARAMRLAVAGAMLAVIAAAAPAAAQATDEQQKAARAVVQKSAALASMDGAAPIFLDEGKQTFLRQNPDLAKDLDSAVKTLLPEFQQSEADLVDAVAGVYAARFTVQELREIAAFYDTPTGAKLIKESPVLQRETFQMIEAWSSELSQKVVTRLRQEMKKRGHNL